MFKSYDAYTATTLACLSPLEGFTKSCQEPKYREARHQATKLGIYRCLVLSLIAYLLADWAYLSTSSAALPDWGEAAQLALEALLPQLVVFLLLLELERLQPLVQAQGFDIQINRCKI